MVIREDNESLQGVFIVWKGYQRRSEVLAPLVRCKPVYLKHKFVSQYLRPLDYIIKYLNSVDYVRSYQPQIAVVQAPPVFSALPLQRLHIPYILDCHNGVFQGSWGSLPMSRSLINCSKAMIVHNEEIYQIAMAQYPKTKIFNIADPIGEITNDSASRRTHQLLLICSFDSDEPIEVIIKAIENLPTYTFIITGNILKLPQNQQTKLRRLGNVRLTGFVPTKKYHEYLTTSAAAIVLTTRKATQPSGACEALSSDTPLIVSKSSLTEKLFGDWAILVENSAGEIIEAVKSLDSLPLNLSYYREQWNGRVNKGIMDLNLFIESVRRVR